ncbi:MAG: BCCT family transporter [Planctomycetota bacterium]
MDQPNTTDSPSGQYPSSLPTVGLGPHFEMHPFVFPAGALTVISLVLVCFLVPADDLQQTMTDIRDGIGRQFGWMYVGMMSGLLAFSAWLAFGPYRHVKLGRDDESPEFNRLTWFAMLFSAGMGIGLLFYSVAEPTSHFQDPPPGFADGLDPSRLAMAVTIFHWGLHPWALYAVVALALAYFGFRLEMPLNFRSLLYPVFGDRVWGRLGDVVDTLAIISTLVGVATSLGIGAQQVNAGLTYLFGIPSGIGVQILLIALITSVATISVVAGLHGGIRRLSELNIGLAILLMVIVAVGGGLTKFFGASIENVGAYLQILPFNSFRTGAFSTEGQTWLNGWTVFFWAWWIAWSPFVGMFIARVSRGRTIQEFIIGVLLVPTAVSILWFTAFGTTTLRQHTDHIDRLENDAAYDPAETLPQYFVADLDESGEIVRLPSGEIKRTERPLTAVQYRSETIVTEDGRDTIATLPTALFTLLEGLFRSRVLVFLSVAVATLCVILFFITSSDSASLVIDIIACGGNPNPPVGTRLFWAISEGLVAAALLLAGGLGALQAASIAAALPLAIILLFACFGLVRSLSALEKPIARTSTSGEPHDRLD